MEVGALRLQHPAACGWRAQRMTYLAHGGVPLSLGGLEKATFELFDAVTEPKVVVLDCSGGELS